MDIPKLVCRICGSEYPATTEYFKAHKRYKYGVERVCKACAKIEYQKWKAKNREHVREYNNEWRISNPDKVKANRQRFLEAHDVSETELKRDWRKRNKEKTVEWSREYHVKHRDEIVGKVRQWRQENPDKLKLQITRRCSLKKGKPDTLTVEEWNHALEYFDQKCAYCESNTKITPDHYVPLSVEECPGTVAENIVPACQRCNSSKRHKPASLWLREQFGEERAKSIELKIQEYFAMVKTRA